MGKVDDLRALREARYEAKGKPASKPKAVETKGSEKLCGHKGVGGKSCTRPKDHEEKNHRYK